MRQRGVNLCPLGGLCCTFLADLARETKSKDKKVTKRMIGDRSTVRYAMDLKERWLAINGIANHGVKPVH